MAPVTRNIKPIVLDSPTRLVVERHVVRTVDNVRNLVAVEHLNVAGGLYVSDENGAACARMFPDGVARVKPPAACRHTQRGEDLLGLIVEVGVSARAAAVTAQERVRMAALAASCAARRPEEVE